MHLAPPLLCNYGCCRRKNEGWELINPVGRCELKVWLWWLSPLFLHRSSDSQKTDLWLDEETVQSCEFQVWIKVWLNVKPECRMFGWRRRADKTGVKVLSCSQETLGRNSFPWHLKKCKKKNKNCQNSRKPLSEALQWKEEIGINSPVTKVIFDMILPDLAFCLFCSKHDLIQPLNNEMVGDLILKDPKLLGPMKISNLSTPPTTSAYIGNSFAVFCIMSRE